jgi:hypothetical protein
MRQQPPEGLSQPQIAPNRLVSASSSRPKPDSAVSRYHPYRREKACLFKVANENGIGILNPTMRRERRKAHTKNDRGPVTPSTKQRTHRQRSGQTIIVRLQEQRGSRKRGSEPTELRVPDWRFLPFGGAKCEILHYRLERSPSYRNARPSLSRKGANQINESRLAIGFNRQISGGRLHGHCRRRWARVVTGRDHTEPHKPLQSVWVPASIGVLHPLTEDCIICLCQTEIAVSAHIQEYGAVCTQAP